MPKVRDSASSTTLAPAPAPSPGFTPLSGDTAGAAAGAATPGLASLLLLLRPGVSRLALMVYSGCAPDPRGHHRSGLSTVSAAPEKIRVVLDLSTDGVARDGGDAEAVGRGLAASTRVVALATTVPTPTPPLDAGATLQSTARPLRSSGAPHVTAKLALRSTWLRL